MKKFMLSFAMFTMLTTTSTSSFALPPDNIDTNGARVFSIGDIHGDFKALINILTSLGLYSDKTGKWTGGKSHLVFTGDLLDRGPETKEVLDFVMALEQKAEKAGGAVHTLLGNHEVMITMGTINYAHPNDIDYIGDGTEQSFKEAFRGDAKYAKWFRNRNAIVRINDTVFVHGGLESWALEYSISDINSMLKKWVKYFQGVGSQPPRETRWVFGDRGPLWTRKFGEFMKDEDSFWSKKSIARNRSDQNWLDEILTHLKVKRVAVGHTIVDRIEDSVDHPEFGSRVVMTDTGISTAYKGALTAFEYTSIGVVGYQMDRRDGQIIKVATSRDARLAESCRKAYR